MNTQQPINTHRRLFDLVRYMRADLHAANLITEDEYAWLCTYEFKEDKGKPGSPSPRRLEDYDDLRKQLTALQEAALPDRYVLGDLIRQAWLKHGQNSWCSIADDVLLAARTPPKRDQATDSPQQ